MPKADASTTRPAGAPAQHDTIRRFVEARLRAAYAHVDGEPIPNEHVELLLRLRQRERERRGR